MNWRPKDWIHFRNEYLEQNQPKPPYYKTRQADYEAGADAMLGVLELLSFVAPSSKLIGILYGDKNAD